VLSLWIQGGETLKRTTKIATYSKLIKNMGHYVINSRMPPFSGFDYFSSLKQKMYLIKA
jgi:hypothetical protein